MRFSRLPVLALLLSGLFAHPQTPTPAPVVVELFTSEGCSSCPPADRLLAKLEAQRTLAGAELIVLGEHVDYWNDLGWKDRFSQHSFTERQEEYARVNRTEVFTPALVVDGRPEGVGNDEVTLQTAVAAATRRPKTARVSMEWSSPQQLRVSVEGAPAATVLLFVTEDNLSTVIKAGENGGTTLHHPAVVREIRRLGNTANGSFQDVVKVEWNPEWQKKAGRIIVVIQQQHGAGAIIGASALPAEN